MPSCRRSSISATPKRADGAGVSSSQKLADRALLHAPFAQEFAGVVAGNAGGAWNGRLRTAEARRGRRLSDTVDRNECVARGVPGQKVARGDTLVVIESMKMEIPVIAEVDGVVVSISVEEGGAVDEGKTVAVLEI